MPPPWSKMKNLHSINFPALGKIGKQLLENAAMENSIDGNSA
jgi:hypothetical protein